MPPARSRGRPSRAPPPTWTRADSNPRARCVRHGSVPPGWSARDAPADPRNVYATTKLGQEHLAAAWARTTGATAVSLRYHNVYGPRMPRYTPVRRCRLLLPFRARPREAPRVFEDGRQLRDFVHGYGTWPRRTSPALEAEPPGGTLTAYNTGSGEPHTVGGMAVASLAAAYGGPEPVVTGEYRLGDVRHITADSSAVAGRTGVAATGRFRGGMREFARAGLRGE